ncbi:MAG: SDR family NAD(P)-dependent oxidoreductase [Planctomycetota bacterium]|jgi:NAD(P)-dependent dehydrogenase (short-subunit alcohol dehydrogenase family)|nr:SDR family NAD(P)-dependent oxidoreductase [Planctomycetota bacterium]MDP7249262.1 SDR family NAD(P)-dependent oxidoreductase [Planctomycetota bacterium]
MLEDKKILITGASRGIGRAIALACARERAAVGISYRDSEDQAKSLHKEIADRYETRVKTRGYPPKSLRDTIHWR